MATVYLTGASVDGFLADADHSLDWMLGRDVDPSGPMGYAAFEQGVGALLMGSVTYEWVLAHHVDDEGRPLPWPYAQPTWVLSSRDLPRASDAVHVARGDVRPVHAAAVAAAGERHVWVVGGGGLAVQLADAGLLDEVVVQWAPVALGSGAPLLPGRVELRLEEVARNRDFACARYSVVKGPTG